MAIIKINLKDAVIQEFFEIEMDKIEMEIEDVCENDDEEIGQKRQGLFDKMQRILDEVESFDWD